MATIYRVYGGEQVEAVPADEGTNLETRRDSLYERLEVGYARIERGLEEQRDMTSWEDFWLALLHEYEQVCNELQRKVAA